MKTVSVTMLTLLTLVVLGSYNANDASAANTFPIYVKNSCPVASELSVSIYYLASDGRWVTEGWWNLGPDQQKQTVNASGPDFYVYAESGSDLTWSGKDIQKLVRYKMFTRHDDEYLSDNRLVGFRKVSTGYPSSYTYSFTCPNACKSCDPNEG